jgi:hypothetical protein
MQFCTGILFRTNQIIKNHSKMNKMKKLSILSAVLLLLGVSAFSQEIDLSIRSNAFIGNPKNVSGPSNSVNKNGDLTEQELRNFDPQTRENFYSDFGYIPISNWETTDQFDKISFMKNNVLYTAYYDSNSELVGTISNASVADLPAGALQEIQKIYKGYTVGDVVYYDDNESNPTDMNYYGQLLNDDDDYFVELQSDKDKIVVQVNTAGEVSFFRTLK